MRFAFGAGDRVLGLHKCPSCSLAVLQYPTVAFNVSLFFQAFICTYTNTYINIYTVVCFH